MSALSVIDVLQSNGFPAPPPFCGLTKNMRKKRNRKIKHAAMAGGAGGLAFLFASSDYNAYINPPHLKKKIEEEPVAPGRPSGLPGISAPKGSYGGWGRLPNVSPIDYADDDPRGWVTVTRNKRNRSCRIQDEAYDEYYEA